MRLYHSAGRSYLVCPRLLELDARHGELPATLPPCRHGRACMHDHDHETPLVDPEGHTVTLFAWSPGCRPPTPAEHPVCGLCGRGLVHSDLADLYGAEHLNGD